MKNIIIASLIVVFSFFLPVFSHAFSSMEEIDAFYDAQNRQTIEEGNAKIKAIEDQLNRDLEAVDRKYDILKLEATKKAFGDDYEKIKMFLPENNPDPEVQAKILWTIFSKEDALRAVRDKNVSIMRVINPELADKVQVILERHYQGLDTVTTKSSTPSPITTTNPKELSAKELFIRLDSQPTYFDALSVYDFSNLKDVNPKLYSEMAELANNKYFKGKKTPEEIFNYMDSLPLAKASLLDQKLMIFNPILGEKIRKLTFAKYPQGKGEFVEKNIIQKTSGKEITNVDKMTSTTMESSKITPITATKETKKPWFIRIWKFIF